MAADCLSEVSTLRLETERLYFREMTMADYADIREILQNEQVMKNVRGFIYTDEEVRSWIRKQMDRYRKYGFGKWVLLRKGTDEFVGVCGISMQDLGDGEVPEVGYFLKEEYWNNGFATEAGARCMEYAFGELGFSEIFSLISIDNMASRRVAVKLGMSFRREVAGRILPHCLYSAMKK